MAKKKRRYSRRHHRRSTKRLSNLWQKNLHHCLFQRARWKGGYTGKLREFHYCKMYIPRETLHRLIHMEVFHIPVPRSANAEKVFNQLQMLDKNGLISDNDSLISRLELLITLFESIEQPTANALKKQLEVVREFYEKSS